MSQLVLHSYYRSSASYRVRIALYLKNLEFEYRAVHLLNNGGEQKSPKYMALNPSAEVPCLIHGDKVLAQSMAIVDYLDRVFPDPRLFPEDPYLRAQVMQFCEIINSGIQPLHNLRVLERLESQFKASQSDKDQWNQHWIHRGLENLETLLSKTAGDYAFGNQLTAADVFIAPQVFSSKRFGAKVEQFKTLMKIYDHCMQSSAFQKASPENQPDTPPA